MSIKNSIQINLAHSYLAYFAFSLIGLFADTFWGFGTPLYYGNTISLICFILGPLLIWWAQGTSSRKRALPYFERGPYRFLRNPTHVGVVILVAGYTAVSGSIVFLGVTLIGYIISNLYFSRYESLLKLEYGEEYTDYKKKTPKIL